MSYVGNAHGNIATNLLRRGSSSSLFILGSAAEITKQMKWNEMHIHDADQSLIDAVVDNWLGPLLFIE